MTTGAGGRRSTKTMRGRSSGRASPRRGRAPQAEEPPGGGTGSLGRFREHGGWTEVVPQVSEIWDLAGRYAWSSYRGIRDRRTFADVETYCMFVGYPRSGHTLVAWLLDAHPEVLIAPELDALKYVLAGFRKRQLYPLILRRVEEARRERLESVDRRYSYEVEGQWQGTFERLRVIGDKKGGSSSLRLAQHPGLYDRLRRTIDERITFVHIVRNPFDNITTMARRTGLGLSDAADTYFLMARSVAAVRARVPANDWFEARHEDVVDEPAEVLGRLCTFLGLEASDEYLRSCSSIVRRSPHRSRDDVSWSTELIASVTERAQELEFVREYSYSDATG